MTDCTPTVSISSSSRVIHVHDMSRFPDAVYIGRAMPRRKLAGHPLANPYRLAHNDRHTALARYQAHLVKGLRDGTLTDALISVRGKPLACWCRSAGVPQTETNRCHADVVLSVLSIYSDDELRAMAVPS